MSDALSSAVSELFALLGPRLSTAPAVLAQHAQGESLIRAGRPDAVAFPQTTAELSRIAQICHRYRIPMTGWGAGTSLEGHALPVAGGVTIDFSAMDGILSVDVDDMSVRVQPGVTRDLREGDAKLYDLRFTVIDTAGLEEVTDDSLQGRMRRLTERAVEMADVCLFLIDGRVGVTPTDEVFADILRKKSARVVLGVNKAEGAAGDSGALEAWSLGLGEPVRLSAEHGEGMDDLYRILLPFREEFAEREAANTPETEVDIPEELGEEEVDPAAHRPTAKKPLQIAVIGRPNAGKSTLINKIIGEDRLLTGPEAGITRDAISVRADWQGTPIRIFDTAGMRKKARVVEKLEKLSVADGLRAVRFAEVVVVLLDVEIPFETQDLRIAELAAEERLARPRLLEVELPGPLEGRVRLRRERRDARALYRHGNG